MNKYLYHLEYFDGSEIRPIPKELGTKYLYPAILDFWSFEDWHRAVNKKFRDTEIATGIHKLFADASKKNPENSIVFDYCHKYCLRLLRIRESVKTRKQFAKAFRSLNINCFETECWLDEEASNMAKKIFEKEYRFKTCDPDNIAILEKIDTWAAKGYRPSFLLLGETGVGKELIAEAIHNAYFKSNEAGSESNQKHPFIKINCAAISGKLFESEVFGHTKGAFSDAKEEKKGVLELAANGTVFFDEINKMSLIHQGKMLRMIETKEFTPIGAESPITTNANFIFAANKDLNEEIEGGRFLQDLFYRIERHPIHIKSLRERPRAEFYILADHFQQEFIRENKIEELDVIPPSLIEELIDHHEWPGNVRQYENMIYRILAESLLTDDPIDLKLLDRINQEAARHRMAGKEEEARPFKALAPAEKKRRARETIREFNDNKTRAAKYLGINRKTLARWAK